MCSEEFALTWDDHHSTLVGVFEKLLDRSSLVDCTIAAEGQYLKAHKLVLSACSPYFEMLFTQENEKNPIIILKDIKFQELKAMIDFMYRGRVKIPEDRLGDFVDAAESLQIKGLGGDPKKNDSRKMAKGTTFLRKRSDRVSPIPRKRRKNSCSSDDGENTVNLSAGSEIDDESNSYESVPHRLRQEQSPHAVSVTSHTVLSSVQDELCSSQSKSSSSFVQPTECHVKTEPEHVPDIFVPETICVVEPKIEQCEDATSILTSETVQERMAGNMHSQESGNQYNVFPHLLETAEMGSNDSFHAVQGIEHSNLQGAASNFNDAGRYSGRSLPPTTPGETLLAASSSIIQGHLKTAHRDTAATTVKMTDPLRQHPTVAALATEMTDSARQHFTISAQQLTSSLTCPVCGRVFSWPSHLSIHMRKHTGERPFKCEECGQTFTQKGNLTTHYRIHTTERRSRRYRCDECDRDFSSLPYLVLHKRRHINDNKVFRCDECYTMFARSCDLQAHRCLLHGTPLASFSDGTPGARLGK